MWQQASKLSFLSIVSAVVIAANMFICDKTPIKHKEENISVSQSNIVIAKVNADIDIETQELYFDDEIYYPVMGACAYESGNESQLLMSKVATDYVEPTPKKENKKSTERKFSVRTYTAEEIAANALTPYKIPQDKSYMFYHESNMIDAIATPPCPEFANDEDIYAMARIIHAEICVLGDEARRCVGTVIINRAWEQGQTINQVIYAPKQFSTAYTQKTPCDDCLAAAYDVICNNYRSFPHYVDSFQCLYDGYFRGHNTYLTFNDGRFVTYFSYSRRKNIYQ